MKKAILLVVFLGVVSAISGLGIGYVNSITAPIIEERLLSAEKENLDKMFPGAEFKAVEGAKDEGGYVKSVFEVVGKGYAVKFEENDCYNTGTPIIMLVGFDQDGAITSVLPLQQQETNGFGSKVFEDATIEKLYIGKTLDQEVDLLSGATVTSKGIKNAITSVQAMVKDLIG